MTDTQTPDKRDDSETQVEEKEDIITLPGEHLRRLREENNMSVKQVADSLHLEVRIIETLEKDDYESGIPSIFMKGYIRNYAKLMSIAPEPLIAAFDAATKPKEEDNNSKANSKPSTPKSQYKPKKQAKSNDLWPKLVTLAILLTLIIFIALWQFSPPNEEVIPDENTPKFSSSFDTPAPPMVETTQTPTTSPEETEAAVEQPMATSQPTPPPVVPVVEEPKPKDHSIHVNFKARVWMRITDSTGKKLFQGTGKEGESLTFEGSPPYKVRVGNYNDVDIEYQGNTKDVKDYPKFKNSKKTFIVGGE
jgi:cytoskeleton protein RodZ